MQNDAAKSTISTGIITLENTLRDFQELNIALNALYQRAQRDPFSAREPLAEIVNLLDEIEELRANAGEIILTLVTQGAHRELAAFFNAFDGETHTSTLQTFTANLLATPANPRDDASKPRDHQHATTNTATTPPARQDATQTNAHETDEPTKDAPDEPTNTPKKTTFATIERPAEAPAQAATISLDEIAETIVESSTEHVEIIQPAPKAVRKPLSLETLQQFVAGGIGAAAPVRDEVPARLLQHANFDPATELQALKGALAITRELYPAPENLHSFTTSSEVKQRVRNLGDEYTFTLLGQLSKPNHHTVLNAWTAWLCHVRDLFKYQQHSLNDPATTTDSVDAAFRVFTKSSGEVYSGHVQGLARGSSPLEPHTTWYASANAQLPQAIDRLEAAIAKIEGKTTKEPPRAAAPPKAVKEPEPIPQIPSALQRVTAIGEPELDAIYAYVKEITHTFRPDASGKRDPRFKQALNDAKLAWTLVRDSDFRPVLSQPPFTELLTHIHDHDPDFEADRWIHWEHTRGKRAILVGSIRRDDELKDIQRFFGFAEAEWESHTSDDGYRRIDGVTEQIKNGSWDFVMCMIKSSGHSLSKMMRTATKGTTTLLVDVDGFRQNAVAHGICRALSLEISADTMTPGITDQDQNHGQQLLKDLRTRAGETRDETPSTDNGDGEANTRPTATDATTSTTDETTSTTDETTTAIADHDATPQTSAAIGASPAAAPPEPPPAPKPTESEPTADQRRRAIQKLAARATEPATLKKTTLSELNRELCATLRTTAGKKALDELSVTPPAFQRLYRETLAAMLAYGKRVYQTLPAPTAKSEAGLPGQIAIAFDHAEQALEGTDLLETTLEAAQDSATAAVLLARRQERLKRVTDNASAQLEDAQTPEELNELLERIVEEDCERHHDTEPDEFNDDDHHQPEKANADEEPSDNEDNEDNEDNVDNAGDEAGRPLPNALVTPLKNSLVRLRKFKIHETNSATRSADDDDAIRGHIETLRTHLDDVAAQAPELIPLYTEHTLATIRNYVSGGGKAGRNKKAQAQGRQWLNDAIAGYDAVKDQHGLRDIDRQMRLGASAAKLLRALHGRSESSDE